MTRIRAAVIAVAVVAGVFAVPAQASAVVKPKPPIIISCPDWAPPACKPVVAWPGGLPRW